MAVWKCVRQACFLAAVVAGTAGGQTFGAGLGVMTPSPAPLGGSLAGWQLGVEMPRRERATWRLSAMSLVGHGDRSGSICAGLVMPGDATALVGSTINWFGPGQNIANSFIGKLDASRSLKVFAGGAPSPDTDLIIDITGFYL
jgi:hypothetical protein